MTINFEKTLNSHPQNLELQSIINQVWGFTFEHSQFQTQKVIEYYWANLIWPYLVSQEMDTSYNINTIQNWFWTQIESSDWGTYPVLPPYPELTLTPILGLEVFTKYVLEGNPI